MLRPLELLERLIAIPSVNPMGRAEGDPSFGESRLTAFLDEVLTQLGLTTRRQAVPSGGENLIARLDGDPAPERGGRVLLFDAHQDTVPTDGMTIEPFRPTRRGGRLFGRGACDVKGGMAAMIAAVARLMGQRPRPTILLCLTVNEEYGFSGVRALTECGDFLFKLLPRRPDAAIVAEPTGLNIVTAHKGVVRWRCHARGRAAHSSQPEAGENAIYIMARTLRAIERYAALLPKAAPGETASVGMIGGGVSANTVPDRCTIEIDYRLPPGQTPEGARRKLVDFVRGEGRGARDEGRVEHDEPHMTGLALSAEGNQSLAEELGAAVRGVVGDCRHLSVPYCTNAAYYAAAGIPTVVFGPGQIEQAHTADEWIEIAQIDAAVDVLFGFCRRQV